MATIPSATEESIKLWLKVGNLKKLEQAVLDGYGDQLRGRNSRIPKINKFLKKVPHFQTKIAAVHASVGEGNLRDLQNLLDRKGLVYARGSMGETPFHTAVLNKQVPVVQYMLEKFPAVVHARDNQGRTPLHYAALIDNGDEIFNMLIESGADKEVKDLMGKTPGDYTENPAEYSLRPENPQNTFQPREVNSMLRQPSPITIMTKTEIRTMIQRGDVAKIERAILNGYGERFLGETAMSARVRELLETIPDHLKKLNSLQIAIETGDLRQVQNLMNRKGLVIARDSQGLTILHKAVLHGQKDIVQYLIEMCPKAIFAKDHDKRTPVHYGAALDDDGEIFKILTDSGGNTTLPDCDGKTPEFYRQNPSSLDLKKILERRLEGSGKLSNSIISQGGGNRKASMKSEKRGASGANNTTGNSSSIVKQWLRSGDIEKLEKAVIDGHGLKIIRETTADPRARAFLRTVPVYMAKIGAIHEAICQGSLRDFKVLMDRKKLIMSRDQLGVGLLHKAVLFGHVEIIKHLLEEYPEILNIKDKSGRTALHYAAALKGDEEIYPLLIEAGAQSNQPDAKGRPAEFYKENEGELDVIEIQNRINRQRNRVINAEKQRNTNAKPQENGFNITGANIRKWIHAEDIQKLEQVVLEGQGYKLLLETSNNPKVKHFLVSVPAFVNKIRDIHNAVVLGDLQGVEATIEKPSLLLSKDEAGMTPLHKAVLLEQEDIIQFIVNTNSQTLQAKDEDGRTALHYAAGLKDSGRTFEMLEKAGADSTLVDSKSKAATHYLTYPGELDMRQLMAHVHRSKPNGHGKQEANSNVVKRQSQPNLRPVRKVAVSAMNNETITKLIQLGDLDKLEQLVLDGHGKKLIGKSSWNEDVRIFLKKVPHYMDRIYAIHTAAALGDLLLLQQLLDKKKMVLSKDEYGLTALHKAVKYGQMDVVKYLLQTFPASHSTKDQDGRTPLHYAAMYDDRDDIYTLLVNSGADVKAQDQRGKSPEHYFASHTKLEAPTPPPKPIEKLLSENGEETKSENDIDPFEDDKEIQAWIDEGDIEKLEMLLIQCHGDKLLGKSSNNEKVQEFLEAVPAYMGKIRAIHNAAASGDLKDLQSLIDKDVLPLSLDEHGACPLHRAVLHGHKDVMKFLANAYPLCLKIKDKSGLTPLHYAALISNDGYFYRLLYNAGADPNIKDKNGFTPGQLLRGYGILMLDDLKKRYEEKKVPPRPHSVQMWERPPTEEILKALTPSPMTMEHASALKQQSATAEIMPATKGDDTESAEEENDEEDEGKESDAEKESDATENAPSLAAMSEDVNEGIAEQESEANAEEGQDGVKQDADDEEGAAQDAVDEEGQEGAEQDADDEESKEDEEDNEERAGLEDQTDESQGKLDAKNVTDDKEDDADEKIMQGNEDEGTEDSKTAVEDAPESALAKETTENSNTEDETEDITAENATKDVTAKGATEEVSAEDATKEVTAEDAIESGNAEETENVKENRNTMKGEDEQSEKEPKEDQTKQDDSAKDIEKSSEDSQNLRDEDEIQKNQDDDDEVQAEKDGDADQVEKDGDEVQVEKDGDEVQVEKDGDEVQVEKDGDEVQVEQDDKVIKQKDLDEVLPNNDQDERGEEVNKEEDDSLPEESGTLPEESESLSEENQASATDAGPELNENQPNEEQPKEKSDMTEGENDQDNPNLEDQPNNDTGTEDNEPSSDALKTDLANINRNSVMGDEEAQSETTRNVGTAFDAESMDDDDVVMSSANEDQETLEENNNSFHIFQPALNGGNPLQWTKEGEYLSAVLGDALITALADVSRIKPDDPLAYLAVLLYRYLHKASLAAEFGKESTNGKINATRRQNVKSPSGIQLRLLSGKNGNITLQDICRLKGDDGSTLMHYAASRPHDLDGFLDLLKQTNYNIAERDNFYRTIRDVAKEKGQDSNVESIDKYVFHLVREGKEDEIETLILDGYDHIVDILDEEGNDTIMVAELTHQMKIAEELKGITRFQEQLELLHESVRNGDKAEVIALLEKQPKLARAKNSKGQTALHMAILTEREDLIHIITSSSQSVVNIEDNMGRTALHYAMGTNKPEVFGKFVIQNGGDQLIRDVASHLPSFYFINNQEIQKLKEEMEEIKV